MERLLYKEALLWYRSLSKVFFSRLPRKNDVTGDNNTDLLVESHIPEALYKIYKLIEKIENNLFN